MPLKPCCFFKQRYWKQCQASSSCNTSQFPSVHVHEAFINQMSRVQPAFWNSRFFFCVGRGDDSLHATQEWSVRTRSGPQSLPQVVGDTCLVVKPLESYPKHRVFLPARSALGIEGQTYCTGGRCCSEEYLFH